ncbi:MAG: toxin [Gammaproteobacteria bacterium]
MKIFAWNAEKNSRLKLERGIGFEEILFHLQADDVLDILDHPNQQQYPGQKIYAVAIEDYIYLVPFVETEEEVFLKTIIPDRKATRYYNKKTAGK